MSVILAQGSKGNDVKQIQQSLVNSGYKIAVDGIYGPQTANAVKQYQTKNGLAADGNVTDLTLASLTKVSSPTATSSLPTSTTVAPAKVIGLGTTSPTKTPTTTSSTGSTTSNTTGVAVKGLNDYVTDAYNVLHPKYTGLSDMVTADSIGTLAAYDTQISGVNSNYDNLVTNIKNQGIDSQNSYSNNLLSRGLGRSSIVATGLQGIQGRTDRQVIQTNQERQNTINNINAMKQAVRDSVKAKLEAYASQELSEEQSMGLGLYNNALSAKADADAKAQAQKNWLAEQELEKAKFAETQKQNTIANQLAQEKFVASQTKKSGGSGGSSKKSSGSSGTGKLSSKEVTANKSSINSEYYSLRTPEDRETYLTTYAPAILQATNGDEGYLWGLRDATTKNLTVYKTPSYVDNGSTYKRTIAGSR